MKERISVNPRVHFGKPCVAGTRIPVQSVLELVREGLTFTDIIKDYYPDLEPEDIRACIQYAMDVLAVEDLPLGRDAMNFLADHDVYAATIQFLVGLGHQVVPVAKLGLEEAEDSEVLNVAQQQGRILLSRDRDFGGLVFAQGQGPGVIYLRILPLIQNVVHAHTGILLVSARKVNVGGRVESTGITKSIPNAGRHQFGDKVVLDPAAAKPTTREAAASRAAPRARRKGRPR